MQGAAEKDEWCLIKGYGPQTFPRVETPIHGLQRSRPGTVTQLNPPPPAHCVDSLKPGDKNSTSASKPSGWLSHLRSLWKPEPRCDGKLESFHRFMVEKSCWNPCKNMVTLSPQFVQYTKVFWSMIRPPNASSSSAAAAAAGDPPKMSSGFQGITLALSLCNSVAIVGFDQARQDKTRQGGCGKRDHGF